MMSHTSASVGVEGVEVWWFWEPGLHSCFPQACTGCGLCPQDTLGQPGKDCKGFQLPFQPLYGAPDPARGETGAGLQLQHTFVLRALQKLLEISMSILGNTSNCSMKLEVDLPPSHK